MCLTAFFKASLENDNLDNDGSYDFSNEVKSLAAFKAFKRNFVCHHCELEHCIRLIRAVLEEHPSIDHKAVYRVFSGMYKDFPEKCKLIHCTFRREQASRFFNEGRHAEALPKYIEAVQELTGREIKLPARDFHQLEYKVLGARVGSRHLSIQEVLKCCIGIALCYSALGKLIKAIDWLQETKVILECHRESNSHLWHCSMAPSLDLFSLSARGDQLLSNVLLSLKNTATSNYHAYICAHRMSPDEDFYKSSEIQSITALCDLHQTTTIRYPDLSMISDWDVTYKDLQIRGTWTKISTCHGRKPSSRFAFCTWIWQNRLYVFGGLRCTQNNTTILLDLWYLDLIELDRWRRIPSLPNGFTSSFGLRFSHKVMKVWDNKAWLFVGSTIIYYFDLILEQWRKLPTFWLNEQQRWPYSHKGTPDNPCDVRDYAMEIFEGKMHIFGGSYANSSGRGSNVFLVLDLATLKWHHLGGSNGLEVTDTMPSFRLATNSWIVPEEKRLYILYGHTARFSDPDIEDCSCEDELDWEYDDLWSYSLADELWTRERIRGNYPSPRKWSACVFNPVLNRTIIYGGSFEQSCDCIEGNNSTVSTCSDVFVLNPNSRAWQQVLTREFPNYRTHGRLVVDEISGKTYLFGGRSSEAASYTLGDLWRLDLDLPAGDFNAKYFYKDMSSFRVAQWMRCFQCGNIGTDYKKCGGSCDGRLFFCSTDCQTLAWPKHRTVHGCGKQTS